MAMDTQPDAASQKRVIKRYFSKRCDDRNDLSGR
jgi:hypothetical protein